MSTSIQLEPLRGLVLVESDPPGADVNLEGVSQGTTPLLVPDIALGSYRATISKQGYATQTIKVDVPNRVPVRAFAALRSTMGSVEVSSFPTGATLLLNDANKGTTPTTLNRLEAGRYTLLFEKDGYHPVRERIDVLPGESINVNVTLEPMDGSIRVVSVPSGARVYLDGEFAGITPADLRSVKPGQHRVRVVKEAHEEIERSIVLGNGEAITEEFQLVKNAGKLIVTTAPAAVTVLIDGEERGVTRQKRGTSDNISSPFVVENLPKGTHVLQLVKPKHEYPKQEFEIVGDEAVTINATMKSLFIRDTVIWTGLNRDNRWVVSLVEKYPNGDYRVERDPGVFVTFRASEIIKVEPYIKDQPEEPAPERTPETP